MNANESLFEEINNQGKLKFNGLNPGLTNSKNYKTQFDQKATVERFINRPLHRYSIVSLYELITKIRENIAKFTNLENTVNLAHFNIELWCFYYIDYLMDEKNRLTNQMFCSFYNSNYQPTIAKTIYHNEMQHDAIIGCSDTITTVSRLLVYYRQIKHEIQVKREKLLLHSRQQKNPM